MPLTEEQTRYLKRLAHPLKPVIATGNGGLSEGLLAELERTLEHHELLKIKVRAGGREDRDEMIAELVKTTRAELVSRVGNVATIYRARRKDPGITLP